jgi:hypothetical protein
MFNTPSIPQQSCGSRWGKETPEWQAGNPVSFWSTNVTDAYRGTPMNPGKDATFVRASTGNSGGLCVVPVREARSVTFQGTSANYLSSRPVQSCMPQLNPFA